MHPRVPAAACSTMSTAVNHMGYRYPELHPGCTGCAACLLVCPDFVFEVFRFDEPVVTDGGAGMTATDAAAPTRVLMEGSEALARGRDRRRAAGSSPATR